jgi:hypothetical protein
MLSEFHTIEHRFKKFCSTLFVMHFLEDGHLSGRKILFIIQDTLKSLYVFVAFIIVSNQLNERSRII